MASELPDWYQEKRQRFEEHFQTAQLIPDSPDASRSPASRYTLALALYDHGPGTWGYSEGIVMPIYATSSTDFIARVRRNYGNFHHGWVEGHPNGHDYLLCGEDYQGQTVIELDTGRRVDYIPSQAEQGAGFCMAEYTYMAPDDGWGRIIEVLGCYWACPYERVVYDFSEPMKLPWPELGRKKAFETDEEDLAQELRNG